VTAVNGTMAMASESQGRDHRLDF